MVRVSHKCKLLATCLETVRTQAIQLKRAEFGEGTTSFRIVAGMTWMAAPKGPLRGWSGSQACGAVALSKRLVAWSFFVAIVFAVRFR